MDKWLNAFPALAYVNHLHTWAAKETVSFIERDRCSI